MATAKIYGGELEVAMWGGGGGGGGGVVLADEVKRRPDSGRGGQQQQTGPLRGFVGTEAAAAAMSLGSFALSADRQHRWAPVGVAVAGRWG